MGRLPKPQLPEWDKSKVGDRIVLLRKAKDGMSARTMADALGITPQKLNNYEKGRDLLPVPLAVRLCLVTGADFDYIYRGDMAHLPSTLLEALISGDAVSRKVG